MLFKLFSLKSKISRLQKLQVLLLLYIFCDNRTNHVINGVLLFTNFLPNVIVNAKKELLFDFSF